MNATLNNICAEFSYEFFPAEINKDGEPRVLVLNIPSAFEVEVERHLLRFGFVCARLIRHGVSATVMKFKKVGMAVEN